MIFLIPQVQIVVGTFIYPCEFAIPQCFSGGKTGLRLRVIIILQVSVHNTVDFPFKEVHDSNFHNSIQRCFHTFFCILQCSNDLFCVLFFCWDIEKRWSSVSMAWPQEQHRLSLLPQRRRICSPVNIFLFQICLQIAGLVSLVNCIPMRRFSSK